MEIKKYGRYFAVFDARDALVCLCVYRKGAREVVRRLEKTKSDNAMKDIAASQKGLGTNPAMPYLQTNEDIGTAKGVA